MSLDVLEYPQFMSLASFSKISTFQTFPDLRLFQLYFNLDFLAKGENLKMGFLVIGLK